jgi:hypothetical protein
MKSKSNMDRAKQEGRRQLINIEWERWFWENLVFSALGVLFFFVYALREETIRRGSIVIWMACTLPAFSMALCAIRKIRALKQHITDLKSGDTKSAPPTEDAPPTREMERAKSEEQWFWVIGVVAILVLIFNIYIETDEFTDWRDAFSPWPLFWVIFMFPYAFRAFRALKREIADLKSGDSDTESVTASTDLPAEGSPTPEGD